MKCKLGDYIRIKHGFAFKGEYITAENNGVVLVTPGNFEIGGGFKEDKCKFFNGDYPKEYVLSPYDLIVTMTDLSKQGDTLGYSALVPKTNRVYLHNQRIGLVDVYNPKAVVSVMMRGSFQSYWSQTGTYESLIPLIDMDFDGLRAAIISMISGNEIKVRTTTFQNDMVSFKNKDDVLTLLIHLGYLAFNQKNQMAYIPNEELRNELMDAVEENKWDEIMQFERQSIDLFNATINKDVNTVAAKIEQIHMEYTSVIQYNDENSLSSVLAIAYLGTMNYYFKPVRELPTGRGFADFVYIPKPEYINDYPALVVELKWNKNADTAMQQIRERQYPNSLLQYTGNVLLVAINYDEKTKEHVCKIEEYAKIQN